MNKIHTRFTLGSLLLVFVIVGMGIAWWLDHSRLQRELLNAQTRLAARELLSKDREGMQATRGGYGFGYSEMDPAASRNRYQTPGEFIEALRSIDDWYEFNERMVEFVPTKIADEALPSLIALFKDPDHEVRTRALATVYYMVRHAEALVPEIIPILKDENENVRWHAATALGNFGGEARSALPALQRIVDSESSQVSAYAAGMVFKIDPSIDVEPRLQEFLRNGDDVTRWRAAGALTTIAQKKSLAKATVDALLEAYRAAQDDANKRPIAQLLERLEQSTAAEHRQE
jgi:HEAT repeat protein